MLSTINEESKVDDVVFAIGNKHSNEEVTYYSCIGSIFCSQSHVFAKLIEKKKKKRHTKRKTNDIHLKHMTDAAFCFIRNSLYDLEPLLTYNVAVDILFSSIKYELKSITKQCVSFLISIKNIDDYFSVLRSFSSYPKSFFESFFVPKFCSKSQFVAKNIEQILSDHRFLHYSNLFTISIFCEYILCHKLISHQICYQTITKWCKYYFNSKFKALVSIKHHCNHHNNVQLSVSGEQSDFSDWSVSKSRSCNTSLLSFESEDDEMITKWQDLFEDFISLIDFRQMDIEFLLVNIRNDDVLNHEDLLSVLLQKYEYDKEIKMELLAGDNESLRDEERSAINTNNVYHNNCIFRTDEMCLKPQELDALTVGAQIDLRDTFGRYLKAQIIERNATNRNKIKIHYIGWNAMWDKWVDLETDASLVTKYGNITDREIHKIQLKEIAIGDKVMIKLPRYHKHAELAWINADIVSLDKGQLNVEYKLKHVGDEENVVHEFWVHADNINECR